MGSPITPQKRNPDILALVRGTAGAVQTRLNECLLITAGLTSRLQRGLQRPKPSAFRAGKPIGGLPRSAGRIESERPIPTTKQSPDEAGNLTPIGDLLRVRPPRLQAETAIDSVRVHSSPHRTSDAQGAARHASVQGERS